MRNSLVYLFLILLFVVNPSYAELQNKISYNIGLMTDIVGAKDNAYNELAWRGIVNLDRSAFPVNSLDYFEPLVPSEYKKLLTELSVFENLDVIIISSPYLKNTVSEVSKDHLEMQYLILGNIVDNRTNVTSAMFASEEGSFLVGVIAALRTQLDGLNQVGFIGDIDNAHRQKYEAGFISGVQTVNPNINVVVEYIGDSINQSRAEEIAKNMYEKRISVIYNGTGNASDGLFDAAKEITSTYYDEVAKNVVAGKRTYPRPVWVIGSDVDQFEDGVYARDPNGIYNSRSVTLTSMINRYDVAVFDIMKLAYNKRYPSGQVVYFSLKNNGVGIPDINPNLDFEYKKVFSIYLRQVSSGQRTIPRRPQRLIR